MRLSVLAFAFHFCALVPAMAAPPPIVRNATDGIFETFRTHPLVGLAEAHGLAQAMDFYAALLRDPRFAREVGNVVLETGDAAQQDIANRYVNGKNVPYPLLRKVWADTVGWNPAVTFTGAMNVYATIRDVNMTLAPKDRIKVWLGDPPIDWSKVKDKKDLAPLEAQRDSYPAGLIAREILAKGKKALVIYGADHLRLGIYADKNNLLSLTQRAHPGAFYIVWPYLGYTTKPCTAQFERHIKAWPTPALVAPIRGSSLEQDISRPGCGMLARPSNMTAEQYANLMRDYTGLTSDALLYLGPRSRQVFSSENPDIYLDLAYRAELERRQQIRGGKKIKGFHAAENPAVAKPFWPD
jgi:hypothetical protein